MHQIARYFAHDPERAKMFARAAKVFAAHKFVTVPPEVVRAVLAATSRRPR